MKHLIRLLAPALLVLPCFTYATEVSGTITTTTWTAESGPYHVMETLFVPAGNTLTIEPGVAVLAETTAAIVVHGNLTAVGTERDSIHFMRLGIDA